MSSDAPRQSVSLAEVPGFGRVFDCGNCGGIHLSVGAVTITLSPEAFARFADMINTSVATFELWMEQRRCDSR
jgi:hypothetical protein